MSLRDCGSSLLLSLPGDVFAIISDTLSPTDICNLSLCCRSLNSLATSEKVWHTQCELQEIVTPVDIVLWREAVQSYKALCRFLICVKPLLGIWVHENPELGNVVYVMPGFVSVVGCRIIPQELGPLGIEDGPILWAPVFEVVGDNDGSTAFILHGRERDHDYVYPGSVKTIEKTCNVLLLEVEPRKLMNSEEELVLSFSRQSFSDFSDGKSGHDICRSDYGRSKSDRFCKQSILTVPFSKLAFEDSRKLLKIVTGQVRWRVPNSSNGPLFPCLKEDGPGFQREMVQISKRRALLLEMLHHERLRVDQAYFEIPSLPTQLDISEIKKILDRSSGFRNSLSGDDSRTSTRRKRSTGDYVRTSFKQILRQSRSANDGHGLLKIGSSSSDCKQAHLNEFLSSGEATGLTLHASTMKSSSDRAWHPWPDMYGSKLALYKLPFWSPVPGQEYVGVWGGTFGWPPGIPCEDQPGKALFILLLTYYIEIPGKTHLIAIKILEGTDYVLHPNGETMFDVNIDEPSTDLFPWRTGEDSVPVDVKGAFIGEGIADGYSFRYPGSKPGSLFELQDGMLAFLWKDSGEILTLQRLDLEDLLKKGERVPALQPVNNFAYSGIAHTNVYAGYAEETSDEG